MSRRQSRVSIEARQNDTLLEFENFKKKFLLANKHITKLNSTLSARIEELNAQISTLYVENLRLRASEIALTSQLKKEREKSRKILADTESATHTLMKQLGLIRKSFGVPHGRTTPEPHPPAPRARRPIPDPNVSPPPNRIARPPTIPVLVEDEEPNQSSPEDVDLDDFRGSSPTLPKKRTKAKSRTSTTSRLPVPLSKSPSPPAVEVLQFEFDEQLVKTGKRRPSRRQSGLLPVTSVSITATVTDGLDRAPSPVPDSPIRRALEEEDLAPAEPDEDEVEAILQSVTKRRSKKESDRARESDVDVYVELSRPRERKKRAAEQLADVAGGSKLKLKDVTNAQASRSTLPLLDTMSDPERQRTPDDDAPTSATSLASASTRNFLSTPATTPGPGSKPTSHLPTPRSSSPIAPPPQSEPEPQTTGRARRARTSVNYAEPKLNTKMRKPDPVLAATTTASRRSSTFTSAPQEEPLPLSSRSSSSNGTDADGEPAAMGTAKRKKSRAYMLPEDGEESEGTQADAEFGGLRTGTWGSVDGRRRSVHSSLARRVEGDDSRRHSMAV
ncbi:hypothetical protein GSI_04648 [Ganoderma sinense ZZ0214-1]|uniref:Shugoshin C-terminal domain-containing protein n=1 Tax=Ganoderma sinense ZZ0214-1 TaxID=1077348 RepID=A0A2G8SI09_9APHY|nr:hypothetical protein GSI_04648 [Ganoderma sinense ZZ0214-1]